MSLKRVVQAGIVVCYKRARVEHDMPIVLIDRPYPQWTIALVNDFGHTRNGNVELARTLAECPLLHDFWQELVVERAIAASKKEAVQASR